MKKWIATLTNEYKCRQSSRNRIMKHLNSQQKIKSRGVDINKDLSVNANGEGIKLGTESEDKFRRKTRMVT